MRHIIPISGKDSLWTAIVQMRRAPDLPYELMFNPTGAETPEVDAWLDKVSAHLGLPIARVGENLTEIIAEYGFLPSPQKRYCTRVAKIYPMEDWIGKTPARVYYGIRHDEQRDGYRSTRGHEHITPVYPLVEERQTLADVWNGLASIDLLPPLFFWQALYEDVARLLAERAYLLDDLSPVAKQQLFSWRSRMNCSYCFFQRAYEWAGLFEHHPDLFWQAVEIEETTGGEGYTFRRGQPLRTFATLVPIVRRKRAMAIVKMLLGQTQTVLFDDVHDTPDLLQVVSCGLLCGK